MKRRMRRITGVAAFLLIFCFEARTTFCQQDATSPNVDARAVMERLDRGVCAVKSDDGVFVSWRWNADDADDAEFRLYRDDALVFTSVPGAPTCYLDEEGSINAQYRVEKVEEGVVVDSQECRLRSESPFFEIPLEKPENRYVANDCSVGDVDGDGVYEIFLKWEGESRDNAHDGATDPVYIDCYTLDGRRLWRVNLGRNIRSGQHYTQICVADFDGDGRAEMITKTADGTVDGRGVVIGDSEADYVNPSGRVLDGPEYMTLFDGLTGAALDTIDFPVPRGRVADWGDNYGNRCDRFNAGIAWLDGVRPSAIFGRGYYTRLTWSALDVVDKKLCVRWIFDTGNEKSAPGFGCGNHSVMVADVDGDGKQEILTGSCCIDDDGSLLWTTGLGHGDAMHVASFLPEREGVQIWMCHEERPWGCSLVDGATGEILFHRDGNRDTGRCCADNVWSGNPGSEFWGAHSGDVYNASGEKVAATRPAMNFLIWWDGDLEREILDHTTIFKMTAADKVERIFVAEGCASNNGTKGTPCLTADLFGDWREELVVRTPDSSALRVWSTARPTQTRVTTLMHDPQYRAQNACEQSSYNQPPHPGFYLGSDAPAPRRPDVRVGVAPRP